MKRTTHAENTVELEFLVQHGLQIASPTSELTIAQLNNNGVKVEYRKIQFKYKQIDISLSS